MATRKKIGATLATKILKEFNHLCALCGKESPQIHHIDGKNSNNIESNLLPICPNHHLLDAHSPTDPLNPAILSLFREYKDPTILTSQFKALFTRMCFLRELNLYNFRNYQNSARELTSFVGYLEMGPFYSSRIRELIEWEEPTRMNSLSGTQEYYDRLESEDAAAYLKQLKTNSLTAIHLLIEQLRFQSWRTERKYAFQG